MWVIAKYKSNELNFLKGNLIDTFGTNLQFFIPKIKYERYIKNKLKKLEKCILGNYIIFYHNNFCDDNYYAKLKYIKGINYILKNYKYNQKEIISFIKHCKNFEDKNGYLTQGFFEQTDFIKGEFINGPFTNMIFSIISEQKSKLRILIGNVVTTISKKSRNLYRPI